MHRILGRGQMKLIHRISIFEILLIFLKQRDPMQLSTITILTSVGSSVYQTFMKMLRFARSLLPT